MGCPECGSGPGRPPTRYCDVCHPEPSADDLVAVRAILHAHQRAMTPPDSGWGDMSYLKGSYDRHTAFVAAMRAYQFHKRFSSEPPASPDPTTSVADSLKRLADVAEAAWKEIQNPDATALHGPLNNLAWEVGQTLGRAFEIGARKS